MAADTTACTARHTSSGPPDRDLRAAADCAAAPGGGAIRWALPEDWHVRGMGIENAWAIHQVQTIVDFARRSRLAAWLSGGLNFQIEPHHKK